MTRDSLLEGRIAARRLRTTELEKAGATPTQAFVMALEEAWRDEALENERLWDQAAENAELRLNIKALRLALRPFAQKVMADSSGSGIDTIGIYVRRGAVRDAVKLLGETE